MEKFAAIFITIIAPICLYAFIVDLTFLFVSGCTYLACFAFGIACSWKICLGVYALCILFRWILLTTNRNK